MGSGNPVNKIPFSIYDFFGYLGCGFLLLAAMDFAFNGSVLLTKRVDGLSGTLLVIIMLVFVAGHIVANVASATLEAGMIRRVLGPCEQVIFEAYKRHGGWARVFPGYYGALPEETRERVLAKAKERAGITSPGRALFLHCHAIVKREQATLERLNNFINAYGFCRNVSFTAFISAMIVIVPVLAATWDHRPSPMSNVRWALLAIVVGVGMFYRYLKFYRLYTVEVFVSYAETQITQP
jgi:hypothetical protein